MHDYYVILFQPKSQRILPAIERLRDCLEIVALMFTFCQSFQVNKRLGKSVQKELVHKYEVFISPALCKKM